MSNTLVAVYGSLRQGHGNHVLLEDSEFLTTELSVPEFTMWSLGGYPALLPGEDKVVIELYNVDSYTFARLDQLEGYPVHYDRREIPTSRGEAWVYFQHELTYGGVQIVESGDWSEHQGVGV